MRGGGVSGLNAGGSLIAPAYGGYVWWESRKHVATDDAYVEGNIVVISAKVAGHVASIHVDDNRAVKAGDLLLRIDPRDYAAKRDQARAAVAVATASQQATRSQTQLPRETTAGQAALTSRILAVNQARQRINEARAALGRVESQRRQVIVKEAEIERAVAALSQAQADLAFAELQLAHAEVRAPGDGVVSKKSVEGGQVVQMGQPLLALVPLQDERGVANFKETHVSRGRPGMPATVGIDTFPGQVFPGTVDSLSAGTGSRFSLLPPEHATGNWVKVVQPAPRNIRPNPPQIRN